MSSYGLGVVVVPHLISAGTLANHDIDRAMEEPLAEDRDEVLYMICTHPRIRAMWPDSELREFDILIAHNAGGLDIGWDPEPWARAAVPEHVRPGPAEWAISDSALATVEGLTRNPRADDKDGAHLQELLGWIFDRHLEEGKALQADRGKLTGGELSFAVEYIGRSGQEALRRAAGPHHKFSQIVCRTLVYAPHLLVHAFPCEIRLAVYVLGEEKRTEALPFAEGLRLHDLPRPAIVAAAEEMLIAHLGGARNERSTGASAFPNSKAARRLVELGFMQAGIGFGGIPPHVRFCGTRESINDASRPHGWKLG